VLEPGVGFKDELEELGELLICVLLVCPGVVELPLWELMEPGEPSPLAELVVDKLPL
jgi:hypothetical protein